MFQQGDGIPLAVGATGRLPGLSTQRVTNPDEISVMQVRNCFDVSLCRIQVVEVAGADVLGHLPLSLHSAAVGLLPRSGVIPQWDDTFKGFKPSQDDRCKGFRALLCSRPQCHSFKCRNVSQQVFRELPGVQQSGNQEGGHRSEQI